VIAKFETAIKVLEDLMLEDGWDALAPYRQTRPYSSGSQPQADVAFAINNARMVRMLCP
jgi:hypothetical protein